VFFALTPYYGTLGSALAILSASTASAIPALIWSEPLLVRYFFFACISVTVGLITGHLIYFIQDNISPAISITSSIAATLAMILILRVTSASEISLMVTGIIKKKI